MDNNEKLQLRWLLFDVPRDEFTNELINELSIHALNDLVNRILGSDKMKPLMEGKVKL